MDIKDLESHGFIEENGEWTNGYVNIYTTSYDGASSFCVYAQAGGHHAHGSHEELDEALRRFSSDARRQSKNVMESSLHLSSFADKIDSLLGDHH